MHLKDRAVYNKSDGSNTLNSEKRSWKTKTTIKGKIDVTISDINLLIANNRLNSVNKDLEHKFVTELEQNQNIVHKVCTLYTNNGDAHKDLFQEITIQLWKAYPKFRGESKFSTWMYRVALNTAITLYRKSRKRVSIQDDESVIFKISADEYDPTEEQQLKLMYDAVRELGDIDKALVFLYLEDKNYAEIAETLGISEVNARVKMNRIKNKLKTILNP
ncbi:MAG TPA: sigma-70 family RNA polymerase sigma factor [Arenibacter sp.]|nr:sigma-70 family RNA polymerase sigma factor [Arenibacter sp.]